MEYCSAISNQAQEPLAGTASQVGLWLLLEVNQPWGKKALFESSLPELVKARLMQWQKLEGVTILFIRQSRAHPPRKLTFFAALGEERYPALYRYTLDGYEDLLGLDLPGEFESRIFSGEKIDEPLFLTCTNGRRDRCCAREGVPVYQALEVLVGAQVWQSSHMGGHRFAPVISILPQGLVYGRLGLSHLPDFVHAVQQGRIDVEHLRGRACYPPAVQAAEIELRRKTGVLAQDAYRLLDAAKREGSDGWQVRFQEEKTDLVYRLDVSPSQEELRILKSCADEEYETLHPFQPANLVIQENR